MTNLEKQQKNTYFWISNTNGAKNGDTVMLILTVLQMEIQ